MHCCYCSVTKFNRFYNSMDRSPPGSYGIFQTRVGCHFPLSEIFPPQGSNLCLLNWQVDSLTLSQQGNPGPWLPRVCYHAIYLGLEENGKSEEGAVRFSFPALLIEIERLISSSPALILRFVASVPLVLRPQSSELHHHFSGSPACREQLWTFFACTIF